MPQVTSGARGRYTDGMIVTARTALGSALAGLCSGAVVAGIATFLDWWLNPAGLFHGPGGNNWRIIGETAFSWWWPVALAVTLLSLTIAGIVTVARQRRANKQKSRIVSGP